MPQPTRSDVHVNRPLTNISIAYIQKAQDFIADKVFPIVPVMKQSDRYFFYDKSYWFSTQAKIRAPGTESAGSGFLVDNTPSYFCNVWAVHKDVDDQTRANSDMPVDLDRDSVLFVTQQLLLQREIQFTNNYMAQNIWTGASDFAPTTTWDSAGSNPIYDVDYNKQVVKSQTGFLPNTFVCSTDVFFALRNNASVLDRIKYTQRGLISEDLIASLLGVEKFLVSSAVQNTAAETPGGADTTGTYSFLSSNNGLLVYSNPSPSILQPSGGYVFSWQGMFGAGAQGNRIMTFRMEQLKSDRVEGEMAFAMKQVSPDLGVYFKNVLTTA
jgi:hypothetical protein